MTTDSSYGRAIARGIGNYLDRDSRKERNENLRIGRLYGKRVDVSNQPLNGEERRLYEKVNSSASKTPSKRGLDGKTLGGLIRGAVLDLKLPSFTSEMDIASLLTVRPEAVTDFTEAGPSERYESQVYIAPAKIPRLLEIYSRREKLLADEKTEQEGYLKAGKGKNLGDSSPENVLKRNRNEMNELRLTIAHWERILRDTQKKAA